MKIVMISVLFLCGVIQQEGFAVGALIGIEEGYVPIELLVCGDLVDYGYCITSIVDGFADSYV